MGIIFAVTVIALVIAGDRLLSVFMSENSTLPVRAVQIDGALRELSKRQIADLAGRMAAGKNIAGLDKTELEKAIAKDPWVARVVVRKKMPDTLVISLVEHVPAAYWNDKGLYDAHTKSVFYPDLKRFSQPLVNLGAFRDNLAPEVYESAVAFIRLMQGTPYQMKALYLDQVRCYTITLSNGTRLILGRGQKLALSRLKRFIEAFSATGLRLSDVNYVDLRYDVGFAVGKKETAQ